MAKAGGGKKTRIKIAVVLLCCLAYGGFVTVHAAIVPMEQDCLQNFYYASGWCIANGNNTGGGGLHGVMRM
jgi:hypothetical protein